MELIKRIWKKYSKLLPDRIYISLEFRKHIGYFPKLNHPKTFNEKLQWLKLHERNPVYTTMVDKYRAKEYVANLIGDQFIIPTLGIWKHYEDIDFESLPNSFVLKCTHDSAGIVIVKDKTQINHDEAKEKLESSLGRNFFYGGREWPYKNVAPRIIAEKYMENLNGQELRDYKFYCFEGIPKFLYIEEAEILKDGKNSLMKYLDLNWEDTPFKRPDHDEIKHIIEKPDNFEEMINIAKTLSQNLHFLRVDLYNIDGKIYFSELTFYPGSGFSEFSPREWELNIGSWIKIPDE